jgi:hypothetical protein
VSNFSQIGMSHLSTKYVYIPVAASQPPGISYDPASDPVSFAFMPTPTQVPQPADLVSGSWDSWSSDIIYPYRAKCLVGPSGTITLGTGTYVIYLKITDNPEIPFDIVGQLQIS